MLLTVRNLAKAYGAVTVLHDISFVVNAHERIGIVGPNGVGKSTLMCILTGQEESDGGSLAYAPTVEFGYLAQSTPEFYGRTISDLVMDSVGHLRRLEERMHQIEHDMATAEDDTLSLLLDEYSSVSTRFQDRGGYEIEYKIDTIMHGLRIHYLPRDREVHTLSGGEKARIGLATLLLRSPDILLLDEPTNHLDFASLEWLETYLSDYHGAALIVSHDRQFLNRSVNRIFEIDEHSHQLKAYEGNYDAYVHAKAAERIKWEQDYQRQQEEIQELRRRIKDASKSIGHTYRAPRDNDKFARYFFEQNVQGAVSSKIRAAQAELARIEADPIPKPPEILRVSSQFNNEPMQSQLVIQLSGVSKSFGERQLFHNLNLTIGPRARIMLVGPNGAGKTTLLRLIMRQEQPDTGEIQIVSSARIGYLPQDPAFTDL
ncbi:MAG: ABC-F family ATP-binding cassette domain-containing protein, partial [Ktedonobacteraceae bacterium]|nr:ABC-F family ATP-binding cassette domain-containing protein [Ktedonobacteraceae bacterium]